MAKLKPLIPIFVSSFVSITAIMVLLAMVYPQFFSLVPGVLPSDSETPLGASDSVATSTRDTLKSKSVDGNQVSAATDSTRIAPVSKSAPDTMRFKQVLDSTKLALRKPVQQVSSAVKETKARTDSLNDSELKKMVQIFEAMDAESAAKILMNMDDFAIRQVITTMKKRQSAKILAVLEPKQAARILNVRNDL